MGSSTEIIQLHLFEATERVVRFQLHLDAIKVQFYSDDGQADEELVFIKSYEECLTELCYSLHVLNALLDANPTDATCLRITQEVSAIIQTVNILHSKLGHLPRPKEPMELRRFARIIDKQLTSLTLTPVEDESENRRVPISIYLTEQSGEGTYWDDPLSLIKEQRVFKSVVSIHEYCKRVGHTLEAVNHIITGSTSKNTIHITIPRIDASNPCRWPTLIHEMAHHVLQDENLEEEFLSGLDKEQQAFWSSTILKSQIDIRAWLTECWCDVLSSIVFGPSFWFSQYSAFVFQHNTDCTTLINKGYPPPLFRLQLIRRIMVHRLGDNFFAELTAVLQESQNLITSIDEKMKDGFVQNDDLRQLYMYFLEFYMGRFFSREQDHLMSDQFRTDAFLSILKYTDEINESSVTSLVHALADKLPIPSKRLSTVALGEKPTFVQETLLAAWLHRNGNVKKEVLGVLSAWDAAKQSVPDLVKSLVEIFNRFDLALLRSIQVSEWFDLFDPGADGHIQSSDQLAIEAAELDWSAVKGESLFVDKLILRALQKNELIISPVMHPQKQIGSTSFDLRLGTSFQLYYQNTYGIIDFTASAGRNSIHNSRMVDLDFLDSITITPGQFMLGHSMEYLRLPEWLAGELEGRSSFARLGLEIHMTAGFIEPGFEGVLTFEIYNGGPNPIRLFPGLRLAQLRFMPTLTPSRSYRRKPDAKYMGLLSQRDTLQFRDYEVALIEKGLKVKAND